MKSLAVSLFACLALPFASSAKDDAQPAATLKVGDPAPKLQVSKWVQGDEVKEFEKDKTYIVEFWATWCGPCVATIPHVNDLHKKLADKGLVVIGQNCWEQQDAKVEPFVKKMGDKMTYRVAMDDKSKEERGYMATKWMLAAGQNGIPCAFIVGKDQKIAWIGHPAEMDEEMVGEVIAGKFTPDRAKAWKDEKEKVARAEMEKREKELAPVREASANFGKAMRDKDWVEAEKSLAKLEQVTPEPNKKYLDQPRFFLLLGQKKADAAYKLADKLVEENPDSAQLLNYLAWGIVTAEGIDKPDYNRAEKFARQALEKAPDQGKPMIQDTLARALFLKGQKEEAIKVQEEALAAAAEKSKAGFERTLKAYKEGKLPAPEAESDEEEAP